MSEVKELRLGKISLFFYDPRVFGFEWVPYCFGETRVKGKLIDASWAWGWWAFEVRHE